jgi:hypothetical protein
MPREYTNKYRYWSDRAKEARAKADQMTDPRSKRRMFGLADSYERLAKRLGRHLREVKKSN